MDWSKAKTILIVALIITNGLLGYVLFASGRTTDATLRNDFVNEAIKMLNNKNIELSTDIPRKSAALYGLNVEYEMQDPYILNRNFFNGNGNIVLKGEGLLEIGYEDEIITVINNKKHIIYESKGNNNIYNITSEDEAIRLALEFLEEKDISTQDMKLSYVRLIDGVYNLEFTKVFEDNYLESTFTNLKISNAGVIELNRQWLNAVEKGGTPIEISSAPKSILALLNMEEVYGRTIRDISLCYYFDPKIHDYSDYMDDISEAKKGSTKPAWRIQFEDGHKVFVSD